MTNLFGSITLYRMRLQTRCLHKSKAHGCGNVLFSRELIPKEQSRAEYDQRCPDPTFLGIRRWANTILTGITFLHHSSFLYQL